MASAGYECVKEIPNVIRNGDSRPVDNKLAPILRLSTDIHLLYGDTYLLTGDLYPVHQRYRKHR